MRKLRESGVHAKITFTERARKLMLVCQCHLFKCFDYFNVSYSLFLVKNKKEREKKER